MRFAPLAYAGLSVLVGLAACSSGGGTFVTTDGGTPPGKDGGLTDPPEEGGTGEPDASKSDGSTKDGSGSANYPTSNVGTNPRAGTKAGSVAKNYTFDGYRFQNGSLDKSALQTISMADYYDPNAASGTKVLFIAGVTLWSTPDGELVKSMNDVASTLAAEGGTFLVVLGEGTSPGVAATEANLDSFVAKYNPKFSVALDPSWKQLGDLFDQSAVPLTVNIDVRSMELLSAGVGAPPDVQADVEKWIGWVDTHPASY